MSDTIQILLGKSSSIDSVNDNTSVNIEFTQSISPLLDTTTVGTVDLNERFIRESNACNKYRLTFTVNPFCTNVLFNACSEFIKDEGSYDVKCVTLNNPYNFQQNEVYGKSVSVDSFDMIRNSEYSRESVGFDYHPGLDFFNNHIIRNKSYRIVNRNTSPNNKDVFNTINDYLRTENGDSIQRCCRKDINDSSLKNKHLYDHDDILEFKNGDAIKENLREKDGWLGFYNTNNIPTKDSNGKDMNISRAINNKGNCEFIDMYPDRTLYSFVPKYNKFKNRLEYNWDYQLTYPYDKCTTYDNITATGNTVEDFKVVQDGTTNALIIISAEYVMGPQGTNLLLFRTATKHNLNTGDSIHLYYNEDETDGHWHKISTPCTILGTGNMKREYLDYYFYISDDNLLDAIFATHKGHDPRHFTDWDYVRDYFYAPLIYANIPNFNPTSDYYRNNLVYYNNQIYICVMNYYGSVMLRPVTPGGPLTPGGLNTINSSYFQLFDDDKIQHYTTDGLTNIPSVYDTYIEVNNVIYELYNHDLDLPYHTSSMDPNKFIRQIINNAFKTGDGSITQSQNGPLWNDYITFRFTKTDGERDCQYYVRKFKKIPNVKGVKDMNFENSTYPLAFANTIYGDQVAQSVFTDSIDISGLTGSDGQDLKEIYVTIIKSNRGYKEWYLRSSSNDSDKNSDAVEFSHCFGPVTCGFDYFQLPEETTSIKLKLKELTDVKNINNDETSSRQTLGDKLDITIKDNWYYGDIVEFCPWNCQETVLCDVNFRFNTAQRDLDLSNNASYSFKFDEIDYDDYDYVNANVNPLGFKVTTYEPNGGIHRKEGYYYKPHYRIKLKGYTNVKQSTHNKLMIFKAEPVQDNGIYIKVRTILKHNVKGGRILMRDTATGDEWWLNVLSVVDDYTFIMNRISRYEPSSRYRDWITTCENINNGNYVLLKENVEIPNYAIKVGNGTYIWRKTVLGNDIENVDSDIKEFVFANGHHYIDETINFYLKRQDPEDTRDLYYGGIPGINECTADINGDIDKGKPEYEYKDEDLTLC